MVTGELHRDGSARTRRATVTSTAGDLAALAAAGVLMRGGPPAAACLSAGQVAAANHAEIQRCATEGMEANLSVSVSSGLNGMGVATARARAGPAPR